MSRSIPIHLVLLEDRAEGREVHVSACGRYVRVDRSSREWVHTTCGGCLRSRAWIAQVDQFLDIILELSGPEAVRRFEAAMDML